MFNLMKEEKKSVKKATKSTKAKKAATKKVAPKKAEKAKKAIPKKAAPKDFKLAFPFLSINPPFENTNLAIVFSSYATCN